MAKFCPLFSGSKGNCTYISNGNDAVLVDDGISAKRLITALDEHSFDISNIRGIFVTHEHGDHIDGLRVFCKKTHIPVYLTRGTLEGLEAKCKACDEVNYNVIDGEIDMGSIGVTKFHTSHDTLDSCGYVFDLGNRVIATCTDLGFVSDEVHSAISNADLVLLESNHDVEMLKQNRDYTLELKRRILSNNGHLSNISCAAEAIELVKNKTTRLVLGHLSAENNTPFKAKQVTKNNLELAGLKESQDFLLTVAAPFDNDTIII